MTRRIVVTGLGAVSALGATAAANWDAAREGRSGIRLKTFDGGPHGPVEPGVAQLRDEGLTALLQRIDRRVAELVREGR